jgi:nucleoside-diphosphate-sugar epimerase
MRVLLTGASGFIGSAFCRLYRTDFDIEAVSFRQEVGKIDMSRADAVVHLSALVHQMNGADPKTYQEVNVTKTLMLAAKAKASGVKQFIFMSSTKVYGEENREAYDEKSPCHPKDPYGQSKLDAETGLLAIADETFKVTIIRTPVVYGEGVKANILKLIKLADRYRLLPFGGIKNRRSMVYVGNLAYLIAELIKQKKAGIFLASDDQPLSTSGLIKRIAIALDTPLLLIPFSPMRIVLKFLRPQIYQRLYGDLYLDNTETRAELHLRNPFSTDEGIQRMTDWYKANKK